MIYLEMDLIIQNHGKLGNSGTEATWASGSGNFPTTSQLGVLLRM
jgi:hypothetical protein